MTKKTRQTLLLETSVATPQLQWQQQLLLNNQ